tara:strand:+ start:22 stop:468 length:447 start_codon:yes stop_codon:yes gene_type:complete
MDTGIQLITGKIEEIKDKISDEEYKQILECMRDNWVKESPKKYVKCLFHKTMWIRYVNHDEFGESLSLMTPGYVLDPSEDSYTLIDDHKETSTLIFEVRGNEPDCRCHNININEKWMNEGFYEKLKEDKYQNQHKDLHDNTIIFLEDL